MMKTVDKIKIGSEYAVAALGFSIGGLALGQSIRQGYSGLESMDLKEMAASYGYFCVGAVSAVIGIVFDDIAAGTRADIDMASSVHADMTPPTAGLE